MGWMKDGQYMGVEGVEGAWVQIGWGMDVNTEDECTKDGQRVG